VSHILDRPAWAALTGRQAALGEGGPLARRFDPSIVPFAAARDASPESLAALAALPRAGEEMAFMEANPLACPPGFEAVVAAPGVQMILKRAPAPMPDARIEKLVMADAAEMLALATLTRPGPFTLRAQALGDFYGIRIGGRLAAMAGERMKQDGYAELSGVCSHPDFRGQGLARLLSVFVTHRILARGETPYLHAWASNAAAIRLYETIGFEVRSAMNVAMVRGTASATT
jgi:ribosomal protein S18 acetylase RimI-like enzyme